MSELQLDADTGWPILPAQRAVGLARLMDEDGEVVQETLVLPNLIVLLRVAGGARVGQGRMCSPQYAQDFLAELSQTPAVDPGWTMEMLDPDEALA